MRTHTIRITYSNGAVGIYAGKCPFLESEAEDISITAVEMGPVENIEDSVIETIRKQASDEAALPMT